MSLGERPQGPGSFVDTFADCPVRSSDAIRLVRLACSILRSPATPARPSRPRAMLTTADPRRDAGDAWAHLARVGPWVLVAGSAFTAPFATALSLTLTGDRLLALAALAVACALALTHRLHWTSVHSALAVFVGVEIVTSVLSLRAWPQGIKFMTVYVLGFGCFCLAAEWARRTDGQHRVATAWIAVGAVLGVIGTVVSVAANLSQRPLWGTGLVQALAQGAGPPRLVFAGEATFREWNLLSSFLLVPFALELWLWRPDATPRPSAWHPAAMAALVFGLAFGFTRAAWLAMAALIAVWWWSRRPRAPQLAALGAMLALAFLLQAAAVGSSALWFRVGNPLLDPNVMGRVAISRATIASSRMRPVLGHGVGSVNGLSALRPDGTRISKIWNGNALLFVLHDSGLVGLAALLGLGTVVARRAMPAIRGAAGAGPTSLAVPTLAAGVALGFAYLFTHGLWLMYSYVHLGLLTAVTGAGANDA